MPTVGEVCHREEFEGESKFKECQCYLKGVHPAPRFGQFLEYGREHCKERERQRECNSKAQHTYCGSKKCFACRLHEQGTDDRSRTGERDYDEGECHQQNTQEARSTARLGAEGGGPRRRQGQFKRPKKRSGEKNQYQEEYDVYYRVGTERIEGRGSEDECNQKPQTNIDDDDTESVEQRVSHGMHIGCSACGSATFDKERNRHRNYRPHTRCEDSQ